MSPLALALVVVGIAAGTVLAAQARPIAGGPVPVPSVSIVIPARNEATTLPRLLDSIAALDPPAHDVVVVDDASDDDTAAVAASFGVPVLTAPALAAGRPGKPAACQAGADATTGSHLLFLDADTWLAPDALTRLSAAAGPGLLSVQPHHVPERAYEQLSAFPNLVAVLGTGAFSPWPPVSRPAAYGPCLFTGRAPYAAAGGHAAVAAEVVEDLHLARRYRDAGLEVRCALGGPTVGFRMYPAGPGQLVEGWTKNLAAGAGGAAPLAVAGAVAYVAALAAVAVSAIGDPSWTGAVLYGLGAGHLGWLLRRVGSFRWWAVATYPVPLAFFVAVFVRSLVIVVARRPVTWRGRRISGAG